jgi:hypothetical protein
MIIKIYYTNNYMTIKQIIKHFYIINKYIILITHDNQTNYKTFLYY